MLFAPIVEELATDFQEKVPQFIIFLDYIVLIDRRRPRLNAIDFFGVKFGE